MLIINMLADGIIKALLKKPFLKYRKRFGIIKIYPTQKNTKN